MRFIENPFFARILPRNIAYCRCQPHKTLIFDISVANDSGCVAFATKCSGGDTFLPSSKGTVNHPRSGFQQTRLVVFPLQSRPC